MRRVKAQFGVSGSAADRHGGDVLLLGDTGRMGRLCEAALAGAMIEQERDLLAGVLRLGVGKQGLVLVNAEESGRKTGELVQALREVSPESMIVLYGEAYAEVFCGGALRNGAADFAVWPIRATEIRELWGKAQRRRCLQAGGFLRDDSRSAGAGGLLDTDSSSAAAGIQRVDGGDGALMGAYQQLAYLVPRGVEVLRQEAELLLADVLQVEWVRIEWTGKPVADADADGSRHDEQGQLTAVRLRDMRGVTGEVLLGPPVGRLANRGELAAQAGQLAGTLIHLAERDAGLRRLAITDELTGAYNRRYLEHFVEQIIAQSKQEPTQMTLLLFDIDEFKHYNDTYGHAAGDEILREVYVLMRRCCRAHDVVARLGGDEFVVLFWDSGEQRERFDNGEGEELGATDRRHGPGRWSHDEMVTFMSNRFRRIVMTNSFPMLGQEARGALSISGGLAGYPDGGGSLTELLATADEALLDAKRRGKNRIGLFGVDS
ncbi:MAG: diguanylate cyclase [Sedimentisphaerales bacterium]|nr:diguanylate cyclase [Sedimentisphaerales bacterium]